MKKTHVIPFAMTQGFPPSSGATDELRGYERRGADAENADAETRSGDRRGGRRLGRP